MSLVIPGNGDFGTVRPLAASTELPAPRRRLDAVCAPGYTRRQRGEDVRTRTTVLRPTRKRGWAASLARKRRLRPGVAGRLPGHHGLSRDPSGVAGPAGTL